MTVARPTALLIVIALAIAACGTESTPSTTEPDAVQVPPADAIEVTIDEVVLANDEVVVRGEKPTPCNELGSIVAPQRQDAVEIEIWAEPTDEVCTQVIDPFEISFTLPDVTTETPVLVNGEEVGRIGG